ncbi:Ig-like domain-containing protein [Anaerolinea sp.]|uniref:Ig-like domain-containing protein n=1 Tax=Anaerolinea sp. TaxID=1872519 RepID=UPI00260F1E07|nr:hypothetical protein [uncultured Anaerolinea sp.]
MNLSRFDRFVWMILSALLLALVGMALALPLLGLPDPQPGWDEQGIGAYGPLSIQFPRGIDPESAESALSITPSVGGEVKWVGERLLFFPSVPFRQGVTYTLSLREGVQARDGRTLKHGLIWTFTVRSPLLAYLAPSASAEIWVQDLLTGESHALTDTGGRVFDYTVAPDGETLVYSAYNMQKGMDLWQVRRDGTQNRKILDCGADWCLNPAFHPQGTILAYSRRLAPLQEGAQPGVPRVWLLDLSAGTTQPISPDPNISGSEPLWAPRFRRLIMWDGLSGGLRGVDLEAQQTILIPSEMGMNAVWTPDGNALLFTRLIIGETTAYAGVYRYDWDKQTTESVLGGEQSPWDYGVPVFSPDGKWMAVGVREVLGSPARQVWLFRPDGTAGNPILQDAMINFSSFHWNPQGDALALQQITLGSSSSRPQIAVLNIDSRSLRIVAEDATFPQWVP